MHFASARENNFVAVVVAAGVGVASCRAVERVVGISEAFYHVAANGTFDSSDERAAICVSRQTAGEHRTSALNASMTSPCHCLAIFTKDWE